jgi:hypothetical protein
MFLNISVVIAQQHCQQNIARSIQIPKDPKNLQALFDWLKKRKKHGYRASRASRSTRGKKEEREAMRARVKGAALF